MNILVLVMLWEISIVAACLVGFWFSGRKKPKTTIKKVDEDEARRIRKRQREQENFMSYDGRPQESTDD